MSFFVGVYLVAAFLVIVGILALWLGWKERQAELRIQGTKLSLLRGTTVLVIFGFFYLGMAHMTVLAGNGLVIMEGNLAPCENVVANTTTTNNTTTYAYKDSCETRTIPSVVERAYKVYTTTILIDAVSVLVFAMYASLRFFWKATEW